VKKIIIGLLFTVGLTSMSFAGECNTEKLDSLFAIMAKRDTLMIGVAAYKFTHNQSTYDLPREMQVLKNVQTIANNNKLNPNDLMLFSQIQMDQAKLIQTYYIDYWKIHKDDQPDLSITPSIDALRSQIDALDDQIYTNIIANTSNLAICSQATMLKHLNVAYTDLNQAKALKSMPIEYNKIIVSALNNISPVGE
jgi:chorismate mutase-like protein